jgi:DNA-binding beta-propeller fold protein YncE
MKYTPVLALRRAFFGALLLTLLASHAIGEDHDCDYSKKILLPTGQAITPKAMPGAHLEYLNPNLADASNFVASGAMTSVTSPDRKTLLVLTSGFNLTTDSKGNAVHDASQEYIFVYDISRGEPVRKQVLQVPNSFAGLAFNPNGEAFYVGGGMDDDVHTYAMENGSWIESGSPIKLGHTTDIALFKNDIPSETAGLDVTANGTQLVVANLFNATVSIVDIQSRKLIKEVELRPGKIDAAKRGVPGGEYPYWVTIKGNETAYISSLRDREIVIVGLGSDPKVRERLPVKGSPNKMVLNKAQNLLYIAEDFSDTIDLLETASNQIVGSISTNGPRDSASSILKRFHGATPVSLALSPDETTLYATNADTNCVALVDLRRAKPEVVGELPTGFYPSSVSVSASGRWLYVVNEENVTGPNPLNYPVGSAQANNSNQYVFQLQKSSLLSFVVPPTCDWDCFTDLVEKNNQISTRSLSRGERVMKELHRQIKHVIYIVAENRTYDQILGDLDRGNGDPILTEYGEKTTPNFHRIAKKFVDLDNFFDPGDVSGNGWQWSVAAREADTVVKSIPQNYSGRGMAYDAEGTNSDINVGLPTVRERQVYNPKTPDDPDDLPGTADVAAPDGPEGSSPGTGYIWNAALRAGLSIRDYGFYCDLSRYSQTAPYSIPLERDPAKSKLQVAFPTKQELIKNFDPYFRGFDNRFPDFYREREWEREFDQYVQNGKLPALEFVRLMHDHMGNFTDPTTLDGVNTPELQQADHDYAVAKLIEAVAHSPYKYDTLIVVVEDDAQDGADHVDAHRSTAYLVGPYVKQGGRVISERYTTINILRTIEDILDLDHVSLYTAAQKPMTDVFDLDQREWNFFAKASDYLKSTKLPIPASDFQGKKSLEASHDAAYWGKMTAGFDFSVEDNLKDVEKFNRIIWKGIKGDQPYPTERTGANLRANRSELLRKAGITGN